MAFLAGDWGTTNLRAWIVADDGRAGPRRDFPLGVARLAPGEAAARFESEIRPAMGAQGLEALLCGMIGSTLGWIDAPYIACPTSLAGLADGLTRAAAGVRIVPGLSCEGLAGPDVLRGEETQILGWLTAYAARASGRRLLCLPGTHSKWVLVQDGRIVRFVTAMTGELYAVLREHSILRTPAEVEDGEAFEAGVDAAGDGGALSARLFSARSRVLAGALPSSSTASYLSGLLIGAEIAALHPLLGGEAGESVELIGERALCAWFSRALARRALASEVRDGEAAALAGLIAIWNRTAR
ncbi:MAG TPA: 2-dehydro-3-deoxygalactonokinase [Caulobacteraceae bacterium]